VPAPAALAEAAQPALAASVTEAAPVAEIAAGPSAEDLTAAAEHLLARLLDILDPLGGMAADQRLFFPEGIRDVELSVKVSAVEVRLRLSGGQKAG
jgi:hypothetical protein